MNNRPTVNEMLAGEERRGAPVPGVLIRRPRSHAVRDEGRGMSPTRFAPMR